MSESLQKNIVFSHANGFPAGCYRVLFDIWQAAGWQVHALPQLAHDPAFPVSSNWPRLRDQLIHFIEDEVKPSGPVTLIGHSLGGLLSLLVACKRPDLTAAVVMLDAPVISGWKAQSVRAVKHMRLISKLGPGKISHRRRHEWPDRPAVLTHFAAKHKFTRWDPRVLQAYVDCGFEERADGKTHLAFNRDVETRIYNTLPHHLDALLKRHPPRCPIGFIGGTQSEELRAAGMAATKALAGPHMAWLEGSHLFPFERPDETAAEVLQLQERMLASL